MVAFSSCTLATAIVVLVVRSSQAGETDASCATRPAPASLLQRHFQPSGKSVLAEDQLRTKECIGTTVTTAQARCWYLSGQGQNCADTCSGYGLAFSFVFADPEQQLIAQLVGHIPTLQQEPWAALECYSPDEDRYHPANSNNASLHRKHMLDDVAHWSDNKCQLACPCGVVAETPQEVHNGYFEPIALPAALPKQPTVISNTVSSGTDCAWKQPPACASEFMWKGVMYSGCATVDSRHEKPWCQHHHQHTDGDTNQVEDWSYCSYSCESQAPTLAPQEGCGWSLAPSCAKEFDYEGTHYTGCTTVDHATPWCANTVVYQGSWVDCVYSCAAIPLPVIPVPVIIVPVMPEPVIPEPVIPVPVQPVPVDPVLETPDDNMVCTWQAKQQCKQTFQYKGVAYTGCTDEDYPTPWCSHDSVHEGSWAPCSRLCVQQALPIPPQPQPVEPQPVPVPVVQPVSQPSLQPLVPVLQPSIPDEDPCTRHPEAENDLIGASVTLDEAGYKIAASADSPINMKRFICRTVSQISCRVTDVSSLMAFVPYYSGLVSHQSYSFLESELATLCHAGGKWLVPIRNP